MTKSVRNVAVMKRTKLYLRLFALFSIITFVIFSVITSNIISFGQYERNSFSGIFFRQEMYNFEDSSHELLDTKSQSPEQEEEYKLLNIQTKTENVSVFLKLIFSSYLKNVTPKENNFSSIILRIHGPSSNNIDNPNNLPVMDIELIINNNETLDGIKTNDQNNSSQIQTVITNKTNEQKNTKTPSSETASDSLVTSSSPTDTFSSPTAGHRNIFFIESSCVITSDNITSLITNRTEPELHLKTRQACAIESAARANPDATIYLFYTCPLDGGSVSRSSELTQRVLQLPNVRVWHESLSSFFEGTPLEGFYQSGKMNETKYPVEHASDVLRLVSLWKYGGTYLDLDFIVRRPLTRLGQNYACAEDDHYIANGVLSFSADGVGKTIASACVQQVLTDFRGDVYNYNGPALITRVLQKQCNTKHTTLMTSSSCHGFTVLPTTAFFPVLYDYTAFFDEVHSDAVMATVARSYAVHLWGHMIHGKTRVETKQPLVRLEKEFCPISYSLTPDQSESK